MRKKFLNLFIVFVMLILLIPAVNAEEKSDNEKITIIVEVNGDAALETNEAVLMGAAEYNKTDASIKQTEKILSVQETVQADIKNKVNKKVNFGFAYTNVLNGFSVTINKSDIEKIEALPNVENVYISKTHKRIEPVPQEDDSEIELLADENVSVTTENTSSVDHCCEMINVPYMHELGYKGQGQAIAIIDTELDVNHEFFASPIENPKYSKADIAKMIEKKHLNVDISANQVWRSDKIPFAYNYTHKNADVYNNESWLIHGSHITGTAAGKDGTRKDGTKFSGVAPETQIIFMGTVSRDDEEDQLNDDAIFAALDDASKMDIAAINMSFGDDYIYTSELYNQIITTGVNAGIVMSAGAGNSSRYSYSIDKPDYSATGIPANISTATTVASVNPKTRKMSGFSSWGTNVSLELKPEITAPGDDIYSSFPNDEYRNASGTSASAPHITGAAALLRQYIEANYQGQYENPAKFIENLMMSSAQILYYDEENKIPYSPRNQGAGAIDLKSAATTPVILKGDSGKTKISLKDKIENSFNLEFTAENFTNSDVTYDTIELSVITDSTYKWNEYVDISGMRKLAFSVNLPESVTIPSNSSKKINCTVKLDETELAENAKIFTNGFFIEGFVMLANSAKTVPQVNIPYMGFYGDWATVPAFEKTFYENGADIYTDTYLGSDIEECYAGQGWVGVDHSCWWLGVNMIAIEDYLQEYDVISNLDFKEWASEKYAGYSPNNDGVYDFICVAITPQRQLVTQI